MKTSFLLFILLVCLSVKAQKLTAVDYDYKNKRVVFPAISRELTKNETYAFIMPVRLTYFYSTIDIYTNIWSPYPIEINARLNDFKPRYTIKILTGGLMKVVPKDARWFRTSLPDKNGNYQSVGGFVKDYECIFPFKLIITSSDSTLRDTIVISDDQRIHTITLHRDFLRTDNVGTSPRAIVPFDNQTEIGTLESAYDNAIKKKIEQLLAYRLFSETTQVIPYVYSNHDTYKQTYGYGYIKTKKNTPSTFPEIDKAVLDYQQALDSLAAGNFAVCKKICEQNKVVLENLLSTKDSRIDKNIQQIIYYNLSHFNLLSNSYDEAWKYYKLAIVSGLEENSTIAAELRGRISTFQTYGNLRQQLHK